jgi:16S rRNA (guanine(966)-N(2))-methyltransferase RsmD
MRVIAGSAKGRQLKSPPTMGTRPMTDRLKTSLFDTLMPFGIAGARVLDLYAGSGSIGIEMLSRGAEWCDFVEQSAGVVRVIQDNLRITGLAGKAHVYKMPVERFLSTKAGNGGATGGGEYDIIALDPPYADQGIDRALNSVATLPVLADDGLVVIGHATQVKLADEYGGGRIRRVRHRVMGGSAFSIYEAAATEHPEGEFTVE